MTETDIIKNALVNVITLAEHSDYYNKDRDDQDIDLIESIVNKEIPMKPKLFMRDGYDEDEAVYDAWDCPYCGTHYQMTFDKYDYCPKCGQRIDWGGTTMNYWNKFAEMLGLELEQEFVLTDVDGNRINELTYKITEFGLLCKSKITNDWLTVSLITLKKIINGDYKVVPKPWKPKKGDIYSYYINSTYFDGTNSCKWTDEGLDLLFWKVGNCFKTEEEASTKGKEIMEQIQKEYEEA